jgi:phosphatidylglycerophosphatase C
MHKPVAFFDVDKTITNQDTFLLLVREGLKKSPWRGVVLGSFWPLFVSTALFGLEKRHAKGAALWALTVGLSDQAAKQWMHSVVAQAADDLWLPEALEEIQALETQGHEIVFVTASASAWITPLLEARGFEQRTLIATRLKRFAGGVVVDGHNCFAEEKVRRIEETLGRALTWAKGYSDSVADLPMLRLCTERILVSPLRAHEEAYRKAVGPSGYRRVEWRQKR